MPKNKIYNFTCRVCGNNQDEPPWEQDGDCPSHNICICCGTEFGYEDCSLKSTKNYRKQWLSKGAKWWRDPNKKPLNWSLEDQMKNIPPEFR